MAMHLRIEHSVRMVWLPRPALVPGGPLGASLLAILTLMVLVLGARGTGLPGGDSADTVRLQGIVARALGDNPNSTDGRLVRARLTAWGDATVEFVLQDHGAAQANRSAAMADALAIVRAVYQAPSPLPLNVTLFGLASRPSPTAGREAVLYVSAPADRLAGLDWIRLQPDDLRVLVGPRWLPAGLCQAWGECEAAVG